MSTPQTVIAIYRVQADKEQAFNELLRKHYPALKSVGLVTDDEPVIYRGEERGGGPIVFEIFSWKDADSPRIAHEMPEVMAVWEPMGALVEDRDGRPKLQFPHVELMEVAYNGA